MKKILTIAALVLCSTVDFSQQNAFTGNVSSRAKAMRMMAFGRERASVLLVQKRAGLVRRERA